MQGQEQEYIEIMVSRRRSIRAKNPKYKTGNAENKYILKASDEKSENELDFLLKYNAETDYFKRRGMLIEYEAKYGNSQIAGAYTPEEWQVKENLSRIGKDITDSFNRYQWQNGGLKRSMIELQIEDSVPKNIINDIAYVNQREPNIIFESFLILAGTYFRLWLMFYLALLLILAILK